MTKLSCAFANLVKPWCQTYKNSRVPLLQRAHGSPQGWCALLPMSSPREVTGHGQEQLKPILKTLESTVSFSFSLKFTTKAQAPVFYTDPLAHPTNCSHFVLICRTVDQKWERKLNNCSVLKWFCIGKVFRRENANQMLSIFFTQISQSGK